jgi:hypothetical protein
MCSLTLWEEQKYKYEIWGSDSSQGVDVGLKGINVVQWDLWWTSGTGTCFSPSRLVFPCQYHFSEAFHTHILLWELTIGPLVAAVWRRSCTPTTWTITMLFRFVGRYRCFREPYLLYLYFNPGDGGGMFLWKVDIYLQVQMTFIHRRWILTQNYKYLKIKCRKISNLS